MIRINTILLMASLGQIMSATALQAATIPIASLPVTITKPGNYHFVANMYFAAPSTPDPNISWAITVNAPGPVTIDMRGFTLSSPPEQGYPSYIFTGAINILSSNVTIRNGSIEGYLAGIWGGGYVSPVIYISGIDLENISFPGGTQSSSVAFEYVNSSLVRNCDFSQQTSGNVAINDELSQTGNTYLNDKLNNLNMLSVVENREIPLVNFILNLTVAKGIAP